MNRENGNMSIARKLTLLALSVAGVMAFTASAAGAVAVRVEGNGFCPNQATEGVAGDCPIHAFGDEFEVGGPLGAMIVCDFEFEGYISNSGVAWGHYWVVNEGNCTAGNLHPCTGAEEHWTLETGTGSPPHWDIKFDFCGDVESPINLGSIHCHEVPGELIEDANHNYRLVFNHAIKCPENTAFSFQGTIRFTKDVENHLNIEVSDS